MATARTSAGASSSLAVGANTTFTCEHVLTSRRQLDQRRHDHGHAPGRRRGDPHLQPGGGHRAGRIQLHGRKEAEARRRIHDRRTGRENRRNGPLRDHRHQHGQRPAEDHQRGRRQLHRHVRRCERNRRRRVDDLHVRTHAHERGPVRERSDRGRQRKTADLEQSGRPGCRTARQSAVRDQRVGDRALAARPAPSADRSRSTSARLGSSRSPSCWTARRSRR